MGLLNHSRVLHFREEIKMSKLQVGLIQIFLFIALFHCAITESAQPEKKLSDHKPISVDLAETITFEDVITGTNVDNVYRSKGVTFKNPFGPASIFAINFQWPKIKNNVVSVFSSDMAAFDGRNGAIEATFLIPASYVSVDAGIYQITEAGASGKARSVNFPKMEVYDQLGNLKQVVNWSFVVNPQPPAGEFVGYQKLYFQSEVSDIGKVRLLSGDPGNRPSNLAVFDNLSFVTLGPQLRFLP